MPGIAKILEKRFDSLKPGMFDSVNTQTNADLITLRFSGWSPSPTQIDSLTRTAGSFRVTLQGEKGNLVITEADVEDSRSIGSRGSPELAIRLTESSAAKVAAHTQKAVGRDAIIEWEGRVFARLRIAGPLPRDIALSATSAETALLMSAVLRGGRLPNGLRLIQVR